MRRTSFRPPASSSLARAAIQSVASVSAGPPWGGLYLKPPSAGGLWDGVITIPSAWPVASTSASGLWLCQRMACETAGVGVKPSRESIRVWTPLPIRTSRAVSCAGPDRAWVSLPISRGPVMPCAARYSTIAWVIAAMWSSLNEVFSEEPRWPEVPKATFCPGSAGSGCCSKYAVRSASRSTRSSGRARVPARSAAGGTVVAWFCVVSGVLCSLMSQLFHVRQTPGRDGVTGRPRLSRSCMSRRQSAA